MSRNSARQHLKVIAVNLHDVDVADADHVANALSEAGWPRATRSLVVREGIARLREDLSGKTSDEIFHYFTNRRARRAAGPPPPQDSHFTNLFA